jgi:hypothetical protein
VFRPRHEKPPLVRGIGGGSYSHFERDHRRNGRRAGLFVRGVALTLGTNLDGPGDSMALGAFLSGLAFKKASE